MRSTLHVLALIILIFLTASSSGQEMPEIARSLLEEADRAREAGRADDAIQKYRRVLEVAPNLASAYVNLGALLHERGKSEEAYAVFVKGVEHVPADRTLLSNAAAVAQQIGKPAEALGYVDRAIEKKADDAALHSLRGTILRGLNRTDDALVALAKAIELEPEESRYHFSAGNLLYAVGRKDEAIAAFQNAIDADAKNLRAYYNLGAVLFDLGRFDEALKAYEVALAPVEQSFAKKEKVDPIHARAYANLGAIYINQKQWPMAAAAYEKALRLDPKNASLHYNLGFIHYNANRGSEAEQAYRRALAIDPALPLAYVHLGDIVLKRGDAAGAVRLLREGVPRYDPDVRAIALPILGRAELQRGDRAAAALAFEEAVRYSETDTASLLQLLRIHRQDRRAADAARIAEIAARVAPADRQLVFERFLLAHANGDIAQERALSEEILNRDSARRELWPLRANLVMLLMRQGEIAEARLHLDALLATNPPADAQTLNSLRTVRALLLASEGKTGEAERDQPAGALAGVLEGLAGRHAIAARILGQVPQNPLTRGNLGLALWQLGRNKDALAHVNAAVAAHPEWIDVAVVAGELALAERKYDRAAELLDRASRCEPRGGAVMNAGRLEASFGGSEDICNRAKQVLGVALLGQAAEEVERLARANDEVSSSAVRRGRQLVERAMDLPLSSRARAAAHYLNGSFDVLTGSLEDARESFSKADAAGLAGLADSAVRRYEDQIRKALAAERAPAPEPEAEPVTSEPRPTAVVFMPDAPAENEKKLAETITALAAQISTTAGVAVRPEFFRRADDARAFIAANANRVGLVIASSDFISSSNLRPRFQFTRENRRTYRRVVVVAAGSNVQSLADLRGRTISVAEGLRDISGSDAKVVRTADDATSVVNALYRTTEAALVSEANPLLQQHAGKLRVIHTTNAVPLPVIAFAPMPERDRTALIAALEGLDNTRLLAPVHLGGLAALDERVAPRPAPERIEIVALPPSALGITFDEKPPARVSYRVALELPRVVLPEKLFD